MKSQKAIGAPGSPEKPAAGGDTVSPAETPEKKSSGVPPDVQFSSGKTGPPTCPTCGGTSFIIEKTKTINPNSKLTVELRGCAACGHWWINPMPKQELLSSLYGEGSPYVVNEGYAGTNNPDPDAIRKEADGYLKSVEKKEFNVLEIGSGTGHLLTELGKKAKECFGVEPGRKWRGENANVVSDMGDLPPGAKFDLIILNGVWEHLESPAGTLKELTPLANPGCVIFCDFPNASSYKARLLKAKWDMVMPFGHLHYFSRESVTKLFENTGWKIEHMASCRRGGTSSFKYVKTYDYSVNFPFSIGRMFAGLLLGKDQWRVRVKLIPAEGRLRDDVL